MSEIPDQKGVTGPLDPEDKPRERRRAGDPVTPKRAELIKRLSAASKEGYAGPALLKEVALFLAYGGAANDTDPKEDPLKSWVGVGLNESGETGYTLRREQRSFDTSPRKVEVVDWASSAGKIHSALRHLDESLPEGQRRRTQLAILQMDQGLAELQVWLRDAGVLP